jgi:hypothetical protein
MTDEEFRKENKQIRMRLAVIYVAIVIIVFAIILLLPNYRK